MMVVTLPTTSHTAVHGFGQAQHALKIAGLRSQMSKAFLFGTCNQVTFSAFSTPLPICSGLLALELGIAACSL